MNPVAKSLVIAGVLLIVLGLGFQFGGKLFHLGRLPGDIVIERDNFRFYFPITTMILLSVILSVIVTIIRNLFK
ncbi:MAG: DUF2905 domain-containing protein [FCB group bacterium]|nr:DUF2905 domain-containing protein [FCB group bacterium]